MKLTSPAFAPGAPLPDRFAREHGNVSPPLAWSQLPPDTRSLALIMDDPDAPRGTFTHWIVYHLPPGIPALAEGQLPAGAAAGRNDFSDLGYGGPRPPSGTHRYFFHLYALDASLPLAAGASRRDLEAAIEGHVIENATLMGRYSAAAVAAHP